LAAGIERRAFGIRSCARRSSYPRSCFGLTLPGTVAARDGLKGSAISGLPGNSACKANDRTPSIFSIPKIPSSWRCSILPCRE
jgi:hypothetical protein